MVLGRPFFKNSTADLAGDPLIYLVRTLNLSPGGDSYGGGMGFEKWALRLAGGEGPQRTSAEAASGGPIMP